LNRTAGLAVLPAAVMAVAVNGLFFLSVAPPTSAVPPPALNRTHETSFTVYPADLNHMNTLAGARTLGEMDRVAGTTARRLLYASTVRDAVTVGADKIRFLAAGRQKDVVFVKGEVIALGEKSITVKVTVSAERPLGDGPGSFTVPLANGVFTYVAFDPSKGRAGGAAPHGLTLP
jgi:acyl-CoA hydrolase